MADVPNIPVVPPVVAPPVAKAPVADSKTAGSIAPNDNKGAADKIKVDSAAEKAVIQKIKVGDSEYDETTLKSMIEKAKGADKKFLEAAQQRKEAMRVFKLAKSNPAEFLRQTGMDPKKFSYDEVARDIQDQLRDPKEVELEKANKRIKEFEERENVEKEKVKAEKLDRQAKALEQKLNAEAIAALEKHPQIPKNAFSIAKMAKYIDVVLQKTGERLSFEDVAGAIESDIKAEMGGLVKGATAEQIIALIGEEGVAAIRAYDLAKLKDPLASGNQAADGTGQTKPKQKRWGSSQDFWKTIDKAAKAERGE